MFLVLVFCFAIMAAHAETPVDVTTDSTTATATDSTTDTTTTESTTTDSTTPTPTTTPAPPAPPVPPTFTKCTSNSDCSGTTPYCEPTFGVCQACITNYDCRAKQRCNAECWADNFGKRLCRTPVGEVRTACLRSEVCYITKGMCGPSCIPR